MFHPPFAYCLWSVVCRAGFGKPDLPSVWPAPGRIRFSGFCLIRVSGSRRWLHLRFPALLVSPVSNLACSSGFRCWCFSGFHLVRLCGFQPTCSSGSRCCPLLRFSFCPSLPVFSLACSSGSRICPALRLDALLCQLFVSPLPPPFVTQPAARRLSPENLPSPTAPGCASSPLRDVSRRPRTGSGSRGCCRRCRGRHGLSARMSSAAARGSR